ncbi:TPA: hypothetical protein ACNRRR_005047 [Citrobacter freundii]
MIEPPKKPGPVAKGNAKSAKTRTQEYRQRLRESGGNAISVDLGFEGQWNENVR